MTLPEILARAACLVCLVLLSVGLAGLVVAMRLASRSSRQEEAREPSYREHMDVRRNQPAAGDRLQRERLGIADWQCTRCDALKSRLLDGASKCRETRKGYACPMVPINAVGDVLPLP